MQMKKEIHLSGKDLLGMVQVRPGDFGKYAVIAGTPDRRDAILKQLKNVVRNFSFMEYAFFTGYLDDIKITVGNGGRFSADSAITSEVICNGGVEYVIRAGSCGAMDEKINVGDVFIVEEILRGDGVTPYYVKEDFKTVSDKDVVENMKKSAQGLNVSFSSGMCWTTDALLRETRQIVEEKRAKGARAVDMVSSSLLTIAQLYKVKAAAVLAVSDNLITGEMGFMNPLYYEAENHIIRISLETIKLLAKR
jgi:uridine phosphorylase